MATAFGFSGLPECYEHFDERGEPYPVVHAPARVTNTHTIHGVTCKPKPRTQKVVVKTTHLGHLDEAARARRAEKNRRNRQRRGK